MRRTLMTVSLLGLLLTGCGTAPVAAPVSVPATVSQQSGDTIATEGLSYTTLNLLSITAKEVAALQQVNIRSAKDLLKAGSKRSDRFALSSRTGIPAVRLLKWVNYVDLMRITGVGPQYSFLLEAAGVDTVPELARRTPWSLYDALKDANRHGIVRRLPGRSQVDSWVDRARKVSRVVEY